MGQANRKTDKPRLQFNPPIPGKGLLLPKNKAKKVFMERFKGTVSVNSRQFHAKMTMSDLHDTSVSLKGLSDQV